ncbi:MAG: DUF481 domain-containing protein [Salibaculum sp.]|uniref:DUF481 domain-containing protein n=1 Tax=Salibaculum sp. TaxID=2855480 RepID=UPI00286FDE51|nr:DUF481 domain-containing protein [Salibaculum sp.]MDR9427941.1 DUF481 domain-containing protein [Salibaculum sp.]MDR9481528.1 DUF481 domain-containing protein [Salibaculum sp.]
MYKTFILALAMAGATSTAALAQSALDASGAENRIEDLNEDIEDDFGRDTPQFGNEGRAIGFDGSFSLQGSATSGNTDTASLGLGADMGYFDGTNGYELQLSYQFSENEGVTDEDSLLYKLQYTRDFARNYYGFAKLQGNVESLPFDTSDNFLGAGVGYRVFDTASTQWSVQAGVGYRVAELNSADDLEEGALAVSSDYYNQLTPTLAVTNDTDIIGSDSDTVVYNDLGMNVNMTETLALRTSVVTEYHTDPEPGKDDTDNTFGVSLVYNFN